MSFGDALKASLGLLTTAAERKNDPRAFWRILRDIARRDIINLAPQEVDSDLAIPIYYEILNANEHLLPRWSCAQLPSNQQERYRVITRNLFSSNAFHPEGLASQPGILARKEINPDKKGEKVVFKGER